MTSRHEHTTPLNKTYWYAVETRVRSEYAAQREIEALGFEVYLPQETRTRKVRKGPRAPEGLIQVQQPWLPGFLFVRCAPREIFNALRLPPVRDVIRAPGGQPAIIRPKVVNGTAWHFVDEVRSRELAGEFIEKPKGTNLFEGDNVEVISGTFKGQIGTLTSTPRDGRAQVFFGAGIFTGPAAFDVASLEKVAA